MHPQERARFDRQLQTVLDTLPPQVHDLLEQVPLHVEDYPSPQVMAELGVKYRDELCGLYTGIPLDKRSVTHSGNLPDVVTIYREGILATAADSSGQVRPKRLRSQIRITILHELAHYHGMSEKDLEELGYG